MNEKLKNLFYRDDVIIGSKANFIKLAKQELKANKKEIDEFLKNQEVNQINKKPTKHQNLRITAPPRTFQIDIFLYPIGDSYKNILLLVDIQSRKSFGYILSSMSGENILNKYKEFLSEVGKVNAIEGDNQFSFQAFQNFNEQHKIRLDTSISKDEHISAHGNKLGIIDRLVRTLKEMIDKYRMMISKQGSFSDILEKVLKTYNNQVHSTLKTSPNEMYKDTESQVINNEFAKRYNESLLQDAKIDTGATARILESKGKLTKGSQKYSVDTYKIIGRTGNRFTVKDSNGSDVRRRLKPSEIQVIKTSENGLNRERLAEHATEKKSREILNKLIRSEEMTKKEAIKNIELLKSDNNESSRRITRSMTKTPYTGGTKRA